jgi:DNA-binding transcriptional LysR family regulator
MHQRLPPVKALIAFESVVRTGSVTAAADELFVTHSAVSKQIAALEAWIGEPLFAENRRAMMPTSAALRLADSVGMALKLISQSLDAFSERAENVPLRVIAPATFAMRWLLPRLPDFQLLHETIRVRVRQTHTPENWLDIPFDLAIRRGGPVPSHFKAITFFREELGLVCSPDVLRDGAQPAAAIVETLPLLKAETRPGELESWLLTAGASVRLASRALSFPHFYIALEAAIAGAGAVVAPVKVLEDLLHRGDLLEIDSGIRLQGPDYVALYDEGSADTSAQALFANWLASIPSHLPQRPQSAQLPWAARSRSDAQTPAGGGVSRQREGLVNGRL